MFENERTELLEKSRTMLPENDMPICGTCCCPWRRRTLPASLQT